MKKFEKAYKNLEFLNSREARAIRILSEYIEPEKRFREFDIKHTVVFFGSARIKDDSENEFLKEAYWTAEELSYLLSTWSQELCRETEGFTVCTGGGPGIMEAANRGADRAGSKTIGLNISLPFEQGSNPYVSEELGFEFHYFFMRKLWFLYQAKALIVFPGGFGTMDELFEALTLKQTGKIEKPDFQILLYNESFWRDLVDFDKLSDLGLISPEDLDLFHFFNSASEGFEYVKPHIEEVIRNFKC